MDGPCGTQSSSDQPAVIQLRSGTISTEFRRETSCSAATGCVRNSRDAEFSCPEGCIAVEEAASGKLASPSGRGASHVVQPTVRADGRRAAPACTHEGSCPAANPIESNSIILRLGTILWTLLQQPGLTLTLLLVLMPSERLSSERQLSTLVAILLLTVTVHFWVPGGFALERILRRRATVAAMRLDFRLRVSKSMELSVAPWLAAYTNFARPLRYQHYVQCFL
eukprot:scaffold34025_cov45-Prasinocladus_malaysianus.AAC.1